MVMAETSSFGIFHGRNVRGRKVRAEISVAEMSYIRHTEVCSYCNGVNVNPPG